MRVLILHNRYRQPGGEDFVAQAEASLLRSHGIEVREEEFDNDASQDSVLSSSLKLGLGSAWSRSSYEQVSALCEKYRPDVAHVHNFWMKLTPSAHAACRAASVATVQTLHNYRLLCANARLLRGGKLCEDCVGRKPWRGVVHRCYRNSLLASAAVSRMIAINQSRGTWERDVDCFIALTQDALSKFVRGGLPADRIFVKPNFVQDSGRASSPPSSSNIVLYVGRLSEEKGVSVLLSAWQRGGCGEQGRLMIVGDGPERATLERQSASLGISHSVTFTGWRPRSEVQELRAGSRLAVVPSVWYEPFAIATIEALAAGRPAVTTAVGGLTEIVRDGETGFTYPAGNLAALAGSLQRLLRDGVLTDRLGANARSDYLRRYTPERNFEMLMRIYRFAVQRCDRPLPDILRAFPAATAVPCHVAAVSA